MDINSYNRIENILSCACLNLREIIHVLQCNNKPIVWSIESMLLLSSFKTFCFSLKTLYNRTEECKEKDLFLSMFGSPVSTNSSIVSPLSGIAHSYMPNISSYNVLKHTNLTDSSSVRVLESVRSTIVLDQLKYLNESFCHHYLSNIAKGTLGTKEALLLIKTVFSLLFDKNVIITDGS